MKKLCIFASLSILLITYFSFNMEGLLSNVDKSDLTIGVYATGEESEKIFDSCFNHGFACEIFGITPEIYYSYSQEGEVIGEFFSTNKENFNLVEFANVFGLIVVETSQVNEVYNIYAISALLPYRVAGHKSNVQIAISGDQITVASPIIMGSF